MEEAKLIKPEDFETLLFSWGTLHSFETPTKRVSLIISVTTPGGTHGFHSHPGIEEIIVILSGEMEHYLPEGKRYKLTPGSIFYTPSGMEHNSIPTSWEPCKAIVIWSPAPEKPIREWPGCTVLPPGEAPKYTFK